MKTKNVLVFFAILLVHFKTAAQAWPYSLAAVPEAIKNKASVIVHLENIDVEAESDDKITINTHKIITVLNEDGKNWLLFTAYTSKYVSLEDAEIKVYDAAGKQTGKYKKKDMFSSATGEGLIEDGYMTYFRITTSTYPVTLDLKYEQRIKSTLSFPDFRFINAKEGIIESNYTLRAAEEIGLRYKDKNTTIEPVITSDGKYKTYKWSVKNIPPIEYEDGSVGGNDKYPHVMIVSNKFSHYGFDGDLSTWKSFGFWIKNLYEGLDVLPADRQQFFLNLTQNSADEKEKIKRIYNYMQENFRYVSIQLGIGGLKPFSADFTDKKKYGDCKALSNYMKAALKSVGIKSHVAIINAEYNQEPVDPDFPANNFNHVILCVPGSKDSTWLECTSSTAEFGELGTFTENRNALLITDNGGVLVSTPKSNFVTNSISTVTKINVDNDLSALTETVFQTKGDYHEMMNDLLKEKRDDQKLALVSYFGFKQPDEFILAKEVGTDIHQTTLKMSFSKVPDFASGEKLFISPRICKMSTVLLPKAENRKFDYYFHFPFQKNDTTILKLPAGMKPEALPKENELNCGYASYHSKYWFSQSDNSVYAATTLILKQHKILAADYAAVKKFFGDISKDETQKIVVLNAMGEKKGF